MQCAVPEKIHTHPMEGHQKFLGGGEGCLKSQSVEAKFEAKLEFPWGTGCKTKTHSWGEYAYFLELNNPYRLKIDV